MTKKSFLRSLLLILLVLIIPSSCLAFSWGNVGLSTLESGGPFSNTPGGLMGVIGTALNLAFALAGIIAVVFLIIGGFNYVTSGGNPEAVEMAKTTIVNAIIGMLVILASYLIVSFIMTRLDVSL